MKEQPNSNTETQKKNPTKTSKNDTYFFIYINLEFHLKAIFFFIEKKKYECKSGFILQGIDT